MKKIPMLIYFIAAVCPDLATISIKKSEKVILYSQAAYVEDGTMLIKEGYGGITEKIPKRETRKEMPSDVIIINRARGTQLDYLTYIIDTTYNICLAKCGGMMTCVPCSSLMEQECRRDTK